METINWKNVYLSFRLQNSHLVKLPSACCTLDIAEAYGVFLPEFEIQIDFNNLLKTLDKHRNSGGINLLSLSDNLFDRFQYWLIDNGPGSYTLKQWKILRKAILAKRFKFGLDNVLDILYDTKMDQIRIITRSHLEPEIYDYNTIPDLFNTEFVKHLLKK